MKKTLLWAAAGLLSLAASAQTEDSPVYIYISDTPTAATELVNDGLYFIYDNFNIGQDRRAFRYVNSNNRVCGTSGTPVNGQHFGAEYVWKAIEVDGGWQFQNISDNLYIPQVTTNGDNIVAATTGGTYTLTIKEGTTDQFIVSQVGNANSNGALNWDGNNGSNPMMAIGNWGGTPHPYQFFPAQEYIVAQTYTVTFKKGDVTYGETTINLTADETYSLPDELGSMSTIENNAATFTFAEDVEPFKMVNSRRLNQWLTTDNNGLYRTASNAGSFSAGEWFIQQNVDGGFKIFAPSKGKYVGGFTNQQQIPFASSYAGAATMTIENDQNGPSVIINNNLGMNLWYGNDQANTVNGYRYIENGYHDASCYWFMVYDEDTFNSNIVNYYVAGTTDNIPVDNGNAHFLNTGTWYVAQQAAKDVIVEATTAGVEAAEIAKVQALVDAAATAQFGKKGTDITAMVTALNDGVTTLNALMAVADRQDLFDNVKATGDAFIALGFGTTEQRTAWETAKSVTGKKTPEVVATFTTALDTLVANAVASMSDDIHLIFKHPQRENAYLGLTSDGSVKRGGTDGTRVFTLKPAEGGFKIFHEYTNQYVKQPTGDYTNISMVADPAQASVYILDVYNAQTGLYGVKFTGNIGNSDHYYLHCNANADVTNVVRWSAGDNSSFYLCGADYTDATNEHIAGAKTHYSDAMDAYSYGNDMGQYTITGLTKAQASAALATVNNTEATTTERHEAATTLFSVASVQLNMPVAGKFYRLSGINDYAGKFLSNQFTEGATTLPIVDGNNGNGSNTDNTYQTLFFYDGTHLVSFDDGQFLADKTKTRSNENALTIEEATNTPGKYFVKIGNNRYQYNGTSTLASGTNHEGEGVDGYRWTISVANWIPLPGSENRATTSICSPVPLDFENKQGYKIYDVTTVENGDVVLAERSGRIIPANTPVVLTFNNTSIDNVTKCVFVKVNGLAEGEEIQNDYLAKDKEEGVNYIVMNNGSFEALSLDYIPGFKPVLVATEENEGGYTMSDEPLHNLMFNPAGKVYTIKNSQDRGYLMYNEAETALWTSYKASVADADAIAVADPNYHWTFIPDGDGKYYLYNLGAQKYAAAFEVADKDTHFASDDNCHAEFYWHFSEYPTAVSVEFGDYDEDSFLSSAVFNIYGGQNTHPSKGNRLPGMVVVNGYAAPVPGIAGNSAKDGCGFKFAEVSYAELPELPAEDDIQAAKAEMTEKYNAAVAASRIDHEGITEESANRVGYYKNISQFVPAFVAVEEGANAEDMHYAVVRGLNAMENKEIYGFETGNAYRFKAEEQDKFYKAQLDIENRSVSLTTGYATVDAEGNEDLTMNWLATDNGDGTFTFSHYFQIPRLEETTEPTAAPMRRAAAGREYETLTFNLAENVTPSYDGFGNATIQAADGNTIKTTVTIPEGDASKITTGIEEVELSTSSLRHSDTIYDLQGRRINKPGHGLYIVNGKKVRL